MASPSGMAIIGRGCGSQLGRRRVRRRVRLTEPSRTVLDAFVDHARHNGARKTLRVHGENGWEAIDWAQYGHMVDVLASGLLDLGIRPGDRVSILSSNRAERHVADLATMSIGAVTVPAYPTAAPSQIAQLGGDELDDVVVDRAPSSDGVHDGREVVVGERHGGCFFGHFGADDAHRDADVGSFEGEGVVGSVAGHGHHMVEVLERFDDGDLVFGRNSRKHTRYVRSDLQARRR